MEFLLLRTAGGQLRLKMLCGTPSTPAGALVHEMIWWKEIKRLAGKLEDGFSPTDVPQLSVEHSPYCAYRKTVTANDNTCRGCLCAKVCYGLMQRYQGVASRGDREELLRQVDRIIEALGDLREEARCRQQER